MVIDMTTGVSRVEGGRVDGLFLPKSQPGQPGGASGAPAKDAKPSAPLKLN
jgi:hypothetical protein